MGATYLAVDPLDPRRMYASPDTRRIVRSLDGGCTWATVFDLSSLPNQPADSFYPAEADHYRIYQVVVPHGRAAPDGETVYALADMPPPISAVADVSAALPILIAVSNDGGSTWKVPTPPRSTAMPFGAPGCSSYFPQAWLAAAPGRTGTIYFFCPNASYADASAVPPVTSGYDALYRSTDGGARWSVRSLEAIQLDGNGGLGSLMDVDAHNEAIIYAAQAGQAQPAGTLTQFVVSRDGGATFKHEFGGPGWDPDNVGFATATSAPSGPARLASFGQAGLCVSADAGAHGACWKPPLRDGGPGLVTGAVWSTGGDKLFVTIAYDEDWQFTGCGAQRAGVLTVKTLRWRDLGPLPATAPGSGGVAITNLTADARGNQPTMIAQPCVRKQGASWAASSSPAVVLRYATQWDR